MENSQIAVVAIIIFLLSVAYYYRDAIARQFGRVTARNPRTTNGQTFGGDDYRDFMNDDDVYGNFDDPTFGGGPFRLRVSDPEYSALLEGKKTVEARPDRPPFNRIKSGDTLTVVRARPKGDLSEYPGGKYKHNSTVVRVTKYASLDMLLKTEGVAKVYPGKTAAEASSRFSMYLPAGASANDPVMAIELKIAKESKK